MKMGLLKSVDNVPGIDYYEYRDSQYYNKYEYRMRFKLPMVRYTWWCKTPEELATKINSNKGWGAIKKSDVQVVKDNLPALQAMIEVRNERKKSKDFSLRIEQSTVAIFSNDLQTLKNYKYIYQTFLAALLFQSSRCTTFPSFNFFSE